jgi:hypothetical protein
MNERIKELKQQARDFYLLQEDLDCSTKQLHELVESKFAELIVRECVQVCEPILDEPYEDMTEFGKGLVEGQDVAIERIKEHFGVEE